MTHPSGPAGPRPPSPENPGDMERAESIRKAVADARIPEHVAERVLSLFRSVVTS